MRRLAVALAFAVVSSVALSARADDTQPPLIHHTPVAKANKGESVAISAQMEDESEIFAPTLYFRYPGARGYSSVAMTRKGDAFVASVQATADIEYWIEAYDEFGNGPTREGTPDRPHKVTVAEKAAPKVAAATPAPKPVEEPKAAPAAPAPEPEAAPAPPPDMRETVENIPPPPPADPAPIDNGGVFVPDEQEKPIYKEWWFIGGAGVIVAGAVVAGVILGTPDPVYRNTFGASFKRP